MSILWPLLSFALMLIGVGFVIAAAIGVLRFPDALQRMHASTKAGTLGAILVLAGAMLGLSEDAVPVGTMAILFMLLTVPVAAHLLGRAAYISGAPLRMVFGRNALFGVLERQTIPLEERTEYVAYAPRVEAIAASDIAAQALPAISEVRMALIAPDISPIVTRSLTIRAANKVPMKAIAVVDEGFLEATGDVQGTRAKVRQNVARAIEEMETLLPKRRSFFSLSYEEGDPMRLIASSEDRGSLLVLPNKGWCNHGVGIATPMATGRPEGLLRLADRHAGPVLYLGRKPLVQTPLIAVADDGSEAIVQGLDWALSGRLWKSPKLLIVGLGKPARHGVFAALAGRLGSDIVGEPSQSPSGSMLPKEAIAADVLVTASLPSPKRTDWYGMFWHDSIVPGWAGEVLLVPPTRKSG